MPKTSEGSGRRGDHEMPLPSMGPGTQTSLSALGGYLCLYPSNLSGSLLQKRLLEKGNHAILN